MVCERVFLWPKYFWCKGHMHSMPFCQVGQKNTFFQNLWKAPSAATWSTIWLSKSTPPICLLYIDTGWGSCLTVPSRLRRSTIPAGIPVVNIKHGFFWDFFSRHKRARIGPFLKYIHSCSFGFAALNIWGTPFLFEQSIPVRRVFLEWRYCARVGLVWKVSTERR